MGEGRTRVRSSEIQDNTLWPTLLLAQVCEETLWIAVIIKWGPIGSHSDLLKACIASPTGLSLLSWAGCPASLPCKGTLSLLLWYCRWQGEGPSTEVRKLGLTRDGCVRGQSISELPKLIFLPAFAAMHAGDLAC